MAQQQSAASVLLLIAAIAFFAIGGMMLLAGFVGSATLMSKGQFGQPESGIFISVFFGMLITGAGIGAIALRYFLNRPKTN